MKICIFLILSISLFSSCNKSKEISLEDIPTEEILYKHALDVPVGNLGVIIITDSLGEFNNSTEDFKIKEETSLRPILNKLDASIKLDSLIKNKTAHYLTQHNKKFEIVNFNNNDIFQKLLNGKTDQIDFSELSFNDKYDDILFVALRSGIKYDDFKNLEGKTNIYLTLFDKKTKKIKYNEIITGSKNLELLDFKSQEDYIKNLLLESIQNTLEIIQKNK